MVITEIVALATTRGCTIHWRRDFSATAAHVLMPLLPMPVGVSFKTDPAQAPSTNQNPNVRCKPPALSSRFPSVISSSSASSPSS